MSRIHLIAVGFTVFALAGCGKEGTSSAPAKPGTQAPGEKPGENRKLTVKAPGTQNVTRDMTTEFSVSVDRDNFAGAIDIELRDLPKGVSIVTKEMTIPAGKDSLTITVKAAPDAPVMENHVVKVAAKAKDMPEAATDFKLDVKAKN